MKTILITSFHNFTARNILIAPFFKLLLAPGDIRAVIVVPEGKVPFYEGEFGGENIVIHGVPGRLRRIDTIFKGFAFAAMRTLSANLMRRENIGIEGVHPFQKLFFWAPLFRRHIPALYAWITPRDTYADVFERYRPSLVFATDAFSSVDNRLLHEARLRGIPKISMVRSWDNLTTKGQLRVMPDLLVVNNAILKKEAIRYHEVPANRIAVVGIPHHDRYGGPKHSREEFMQSIGVEPGKKLVIYAALGDPFFSGLNYFDAAVIDFIAELLPPSHQLLVRMPPAMPVSLEKLRHRDQVLFEYPGARHGESADGIFKTELGRVDDDHLIDTLSYADMLISVTTTLLLDAALCDRPTIVVDFDYRDGVSKSGAPFGLLKYIHMQPLLKSGGVRVARSPDELSRALKEYLDDPSMDHAGRMRVRDTIADGYDGHASERLLAVVRSVLDRAPQ